MKHSAKVALAVIGSIIAAALVIVGAIFLFGGGQMLTAPFRGQVDQTERVEADGAYRIAAYDEFFDRCAAVQADEDRLANLVAERETASADRQFQIDATTTAVQNSRAEKIREYNADAAKEGTRGQFRSSDLPYELNVNQESTSCAG